MDEKILEGSAPMLIGNIIPFFLDKLRKTTKIPLQDSLSSDPDLKPETSKYGKGVLPT
jgi:hypothetical protein